MTASMEWMEPPVCQSEPGNRAAIRDRKAKKAPRKWPFYTVQGGFTIVLDSTRGTMSELALKVNPLLAPTLLRRESRWPRDTCRLQRSPLSPACMRPLLARLQRPGCVAISHLTTRSNGGSWPGPARVPEPPRSRRPPQRTLKEDLVQRIPFRMVTSPCPPTFHDQSRGSEDLGHAREPWLRWLLPRHWGPS
jgi:hypothetical protein